MSKPIDDYREMFDPLTLKATPARQVVLVWPGVFVDPTDVAGVCVQGNARTKDGVVEIERYRRHSILLTFDTPETAVRAAAIIADRVNREEVPFPGQEVDEPAPEPMEVGEVDGEGVEP